MQLLLCFLRDVVLELVEFIFLSLDVLVMGQFLFLVPTELLSFPYSRVSAESHLNH